VAAPRPLAVVELANQVRSSARDFGDLRGRDGRDPTSAASATSATPTWRTSDRAERTSRPAFERRRGPAAAPRRRRAGGANVFRGQRQVGEQGGEGDLGSRAVVDDPGRGAPAAMIEALREQEGNVVDG